MADSNRMTTELNEMVSRIQSLHPERTDIEDIPLHEVLELSDELGDDFLVLRTSLWSLVGALAEVGMY